MNARSNHPSAAALLALALGFVPRASAAPPTYSVTDLGTLGTSSDVSEAFAINASGTIAGRSTVSGHDHAFLWSSGTMTDLGTIGGPESYGKAINGAGIVAGYSSSTDAFGSVHAFRQTGGGLADLGYLGGNPTGRSYGYGINDAGVIVGESEGRAFFDTGGGLTALPSAPGGYYTAATAIGGTGLIVGWAQFSYGTRACYWEPTVPFDIGDLGGVSRAYAVSQPDADFAHVWIVGYSDGPGITHAFRWHSGTLVDLGALPSYPISTAYGVNASGATVGQSTVYLNGPGHGFLDLPGEGMYDLNTLLVPGSGWEIAVGYAINDAGWIVGRASSFTLGEHAVLLKPVSTASVAPAAADLEFAGASPNPVADAASFRFALVAPGRVRLELFDLAGRSIATLAEGNAEAGPQTARWDGRDGSGSPVASGVYWARLTAAGRTITRRFSVVR